MITTFGFTTFERRRIDRTKLSRKKSVEIPEVKRDSLSGWWYTWDNDIPNIWKI
jgi:hypothetical protein